MPIDEVLQDLSNLIDTVPPIHQPMRFGNKAFRQFLDKVRETYPTIIGKILKTAAQKRAADEIKEYFMDAFGCYERIDYGNARVESFI